MGDIIGRAKDWQVLVWHGKVINAQHAVVWITHLQAPLYICARVVGVNSSDLRPLSLYSHQGDHCNITPWITSFSYLTTSTNGMRYLISAVGEVGEGERSIVSQLCRQEHLLARAGATACVINWHSCDWADPLWSLQIQMFLWCQPFRWLSDDKSNPAISHCQCCPRNTTRTSPAAHLSHLAVGTCSGSFRWRSKRAARFGTDFLPDHRLYRRVDHFHPFIIDKRIQIPLNEWNY